MVVIAPHGGMIERYTDCQAERVAVELSGISCWRCKGWKPDNGAFDRWHITSTDIHEASFPLLNSIVNRGFAHAVAFHGFSEDDILIGGGASDSFKTELKEAIDDALNSESSACKVTIRIARPEDNPNGDSPENIVDRLASGNGIQIEQLWRFERAVGRRSPTQLLRFRGESCPQHLRGRFEMGKYRTTIGKAALFKCRNS